MDDEKYKKELMAQRQRAQARAYLEKNGVGPGKYEAALNDKGEMQALAEKKNLTSTGSGDNTLNLIRQQSAAKALKSNASEHQAKQAIIEQQKQLRDSTAAATAAVNTANDALPKGWKAVKDPTSGGTYYWSVSTRETTWTKPIAPAEENTPNSSTASAASRDSRLPEGWEELVHPATNQVYYKHVSGKRSGVRPTDSGVAVPTGQAEAIVAPTDKRKRMDTEAQAKEKQRRLVVDPLDPMGGIGRKWSNGIDVGGKMADSTASGPLWQQRPYPAPGQALKGKDKPTSGVEAGPTLPS